jgi:hypothetical protein
MVRYKKLLHLGLVSVDGFLLLTIKEQNLHIQIDILICILQCFLMILVCGSNFCNEFIFYKVAFFFFFL